MLLGVHPRNTCFSFNWHNVRHINGFLEREIAGLRSRLVVADIGGGASPYHAFFAGKLARYTCVDLPDALPSNDSRGIERIVGTAEDIPMADGSVDVVLCNQVLEHVTDPARSVAEIHRILKPSGVFLGSVPHVSPVHLEPYDFRRYTDLGVRQLLSQHGFASVNVEGNGGVFTAAALMIAMDLILSRRVEGRPQSASGYRQVLLSPLICAMNLVAVPLDRLFGRTQRTPANLCWYARRP